MRYLQNGFVVAARVLFTLAFAVTLVVIFCENSGLNFAPLDLLASLPIGNALGHIWVYGLLALLLNITLQGKYFVIPIGSSRNAVSGIRSIGLQWGSLWIILFATVDELSQAFTPDRFLSLNDCIANFAGVYLASLLMQKVGVVQSEQLSSVEINKPLSSAEDWQWER